VDKGLKRTDEKYSMFGNLPLLIPHEFGVCLIAKINLLGVSTPLKNRTTVEVREHLPAPSHRYGSARLRTEPLFPCRRKPAYRKRED
jgi:hypothetical protein